MLRDDDLYTQNVDPNDFLAHVQLFPVMVSPRAQYKHQQGLPPSDADCWRYLASQGSMGSTCASQCIEEPWPLVSGSTSLVGSGPSHESSLVTQTDAMSEEFGIPTMESVPPMQHVISESRLPSVNNVGWARNVAESDYETEYFQPFHTSEPFLHSLQMGMKDVQGFYVEKTGTSPSRNSFHSPSTASSPYRSTFDHCMLGIDDYKGTYPSCDRLPSRSGSRSIHHAQPEEMQISRYSELSPNVAFFQSSLEEEARHKSSAHVLVRTSSRFGGPSRRHSKTTERPSSSSRSAESGDGRIPLPPPDLTPASVSSRPLRHGQKAILTVEPLPNNSRGLQTESAGYLESPLRSSVSDVSLSTDEDPVMNPSLGTKFIPYPDTECPPSSNKGLACLTCRRRKVACGKQPRPGSRDPRCNQCRAINEENCQFPAHSMRGHYVRKSGGNRKSVMGA